MMTQILCTNNEKKNGKDIPEVIPIQLGHVSAFIIRDTGSILVDTGFPGSEHAILKKMHEYGIRPDDIHLILITHGHMDHYGSAEALRSLTGAKIAVHECDAQYIRTGTNGTYYPTRMTGKILSLFTGFVKRTMPGIEPDILLHDSLDLGEYDIRGRVIPTPGHTPGSVSVVLEGGTIILGDLLMAFFPKKIPRYAYWADSLPILQKSVNNLMSCSPSRIYAGHGGPFTPEDVRKYL